jgi:hypothetical protein
MVKLDAHNDTYKWTSESIERIFKGEVNSAPSDLVKMMIENLYELCRMQEAMLIETINEMERRRFWSRVKRMFRRIRHVQSV